MTSKKCPECLLVHFPSDTNCRECGNSLIEIGSPSQNKGKSIIYNGGLSRGVNGIIIITTAIIVCTLTLFWAKELIPDGTYLIGCFLPFGFIGYVAGVILANIANIIYKQME